MQPQGEPDSLRAPGDDPLVVPEDVGKAAAQLLLDEVSRGGVVDGAHQGLLLVLAALGSEQISRVSGCECVWLCVCRGESIAHQGLLLALSPEHINNTLLLAHTCAASRTHLHTAATLKPLRCASAR